VPVPPKRDDLDRAFQDALSHREASRKRHEEDLRTLEAVAAEGKAAGKRAGQIAAAVIAVVVVALGWVMLRDPAYRGIFGFFLLLLVFFAAWRFWKARA